MCLFLNIDHWFHILLLAVGLNGLAFRDRIMAFLDIYQ